MRAMRLLRLAIVFCSVAACGGGNKPVVAEPPPPADPIPTTAGPACKAVAEHMVTVVLADKPDAHAKAIAKLQTHCTDDKWSDEARSCLGTAQTDSEAEGCVKMLTAAQRDALEQAVPPPTEASSVHDDKSTGAAPPPAPTPARRSRGVKKKPPPSKTGADPCQGGEIESDPCQGGQ
jgi:hypothetical protein